MSSTTLQHRANRHASDRLNRRQTVPGLIPRHHRISRQIALLVLVAALLLPAAVLARPRSQPATTPSVWAQALSWLTDLLGGRQGTGTGRQQDGLTSLPGDAGSTIDPDGARRTALVADPAPTERKPPASTADGTLPPG